MKEISLEYAVEMARVKNIETGLYIEVVPKFYVSEETFCNIRNKCRFLKGNARGEFRYGDSDNCIVTSRYCWANRCLKLEESDRKPENELRQDLAELINKNIKHYKKENLGLKSEIEIARLDGYKTADEKKEVKANQEIIDILKKIDPKTVKLTYKPTPKIVYPKGWTDY